MSTIFSKALTEERDKLGVLDHIMQTNPEVTELYLKQEQVVESVYVLEYQASEIDYAIRQVQTMNHQGELDVAVKILEGRYKEHLDTLDVITNISQRNFKAFEELTRVN